MIFMKNSGHFHHNVVHYVIMKSWFPTHLVPEGPSQDSMGLWDAIDVHVLGGVTGGSNSRPGYRFTGLAISITQPPAGTSSIWRAANSHDVT